MISVKISRLQFYLEIKIKLMVEEVGFSRFFQYPDHKSRHKKIKFVAGSNSPSKKLKIKKKSRLELEKSRY